jgi:NAD(P)-dependent dehydrogenase (short-subunit alcohol dehydrogenase family)
MNQYGSFPSLRNKRVFITGGGTGIGAAMVRAFAEQGAAVAFVDIARDASVALSAQLAAQGYAAPQYRWCDLRDVASLQQAMLELACALGDFHVLINNAANDQRHALADVTPEYWDECVAVNQRPLFFACQSVVAGMRRQGGGSIINVGSTGWRNKAAGYPVYATAKSAVAGLTRGLARELGEHNIRINSLTPGWVMTDRQLATWVDANAREEIGRNQLMPGQLQPQHVARMALFLAADDSAMCTAQDFVVDGGWS